MVCITDSDVGQEKMTKQQYTKYEDEFSFSKTDFKELFDLFNESFDKLSLRSVRGYSEPEAVEGYPSNHWRDGKEEQGFGSLMMDKAGKQWKSFHFKFFDSTDHSHRYFKLKVNMDDRRYGIVASLDNYQKLADLSQDVANVFEPVHKIEIKRPQELSLPDKITLSWLRRHVPIKFWLWFGGLLITAFLLGYNSNTFLNTVTKSSPNNLMQVTPKSGAPD